MDDSIWTRLAPESVTGVLAAEVEDSFRRRVAGVATAPERAFDLVCDAAHRVKLEAIAGDLSLSVLRTLERFLLLRPGLGDIDRMKIGELLDKGGFEPRAILELGAAAEHWTQARGVRTVGGRREADCERERGRNGSRQYELGFDPAMQVAMRRRAATLPVATVGGGSRMGLTGGFSEIDERPSSAQHQSHEESDPLRAIMGAGHDPMSAHPKLHDRSGDRIAVSDEEHVATEPEVAKAPAKWEPVHHENAWPRPGFPLLPRGLREAWADRDIPTKPSSLCEDVGKLTPSSLDESVWWRFSEEAIRWVVARALKEAVSRCGFAHRACSMSTTRAFPGLVPEWTTLLALPLSRRSHNVVVGLRKRFAVLKEPAELTLGDLASCHGAGAKTLLEITTVAEGCLRQTESGTRGPARPAQEAGGSEPKLPDTDEAGSAVASTFGRLMERLEADALLHNLAEWSCADPRLRSLGLTGESVLSALQAIVLGAPTVECLEEAEQRLTDAVGLTIALEAEPLDAALLRLLASVVSRRYFRPIARRLGWDGAGGCTLEEAARDAGVTRERIRQVETKILARIKTVRRFKQLDSAVAVVHQTRTSWPVVPLSALEANGVVAAPFLPFGILTAARAMGRKVEFEVSMGAESVRFPGQPVVQSVRLALATFKSTGNVGRYDELLKRMAAREGGGPAREALVALVEETGEVRWLDAERDWFWHPAGFGGSRYLNLARKILAVSETVSLSSVRAGVFRHYRTRGQDLPLEIFAALLVAGGFEVRDGAVFAGRASVGSLAGSDGHLAGLLQQRGGVAHIAELRQAWRSSGFRSVTLQIALGNAPFIERLASGIYALRGMRVDPAQVETLRAFRWGGPTLRDWGWTPDGAIWMAQGVTASLQASRVLSVPAAARRLLRRDRFDLIGTDGEHLGHLALGSGGNAWGLGRYFNRYDPREGEVLVIALDPRLGKALIQHGDRGLVESYQEGVGEGPATFADEDLD
ncbi:MAG: hypothetical protein M5U13_03855 [Thermoanaerobaculia bacterium]|nr:hypothetical protein [Thermoanaerobaculia bacterium]